VEVDAAVKDECEVELDVTIGFLIVEIPNKPQPQKIAITAITAKSTGCFFADTWVPELSSVRRSRPQY
jgi:hypothetical protein